MAAGARAAGAGALAVGSDLAGSRAIRAASAGMGRSEPSMDADRSLPPDLFLRHASGLRSLAGALLRDEHAADDVLQDTWLAALQRPPATRDQLSGWLARVARRLALRRRRGEGRRIGRERAVSRPERLAPADEGLARREVLRTVVDAVLALEEPYQSVVLLRYYQDLTPREIAARRGVPVATVASQLHRAREHLRRRLEAEVGGERGAWAPALALATGWRSGPVPVAPPAPAAPAGASGGAGAVLGGMTMEWKILFGAATAAAVVGGVARWSDGAGARAVPARDAAAGAVELVADAPPAQPGEGPGAAREGERRPAVAPGELEWLALGPAAPDELALTVTVVDADDLPLEGVHVDLAEALGPLNDAGETGPDGTLRRVWRGRGELELLLRARKGGVEDDGLRAVRLLPGQEAHVRLRVRRDASDRVPDCVEGAKELRELERRDARGELVSGELHVTLERNVWRGAPGPHERPALGAGPGGTARLVWPPVETAVVTDVSFGSVLKLKELARHHDHLVARVHFEEARKPEKPPTVRLAGTVRDADGRPVAGAAVAVLGAGGTPARTGSGGEFAIDVATGHGPTELGVRAGGGDHGLASATFDFAGGEPGTELRWDPVLERGLELGGRLVDAERHPLAGWTVDVSVDGTWHDATVTGEDGGFAIPNLPAGAVELRARPDPSLPFAVHVERSLRAGGGRRDVVVPDAAAEPGALRSSVVDAAGEAIADAEVRVLSAVTGEGAWMRAAEDGDLALSHVAPGVYRVVAGSLARGFVDAGLVEVAAGAEVDLGRLELAAPGAARWAAPGELGWTLVRRGRALDALVAEGEPGEAFEAPLPAGEYALELRGEGLAGAPLRFEVAPGAELELDPAPRALGELRIELAREPDAAVAIEIVDAGGGTVSGALTGDRGRVRLAAGRYVVRAGDGAGATVDVDAGEPTSVRLDLP